MPQFCLFEPSKINSLVKSLNLILSGSGKSKESSFSGNDSRLSSSVRHVPVLALSLDPLDPIFGEVEEDEGVGGVAGDDDLKRVDLQKGDVSRLMYFY